MRIILRSKKEMAFNLGKYIQSKWQHDIKKNKCEYKNIKFYLAATNHIFMRLFSLANCMDWQLSNNYDNKIRGKNKIPKMSYD